MGIGVFLLIVAVIVLAWLQHKANSKIIKQDYEDWKSNRR